MCKYNFCPAVSQVNITIHELVSHLIIYFQAFNKSKCTF